MLLRVLMAVVHSQTPVLLRSKGETVIFASSTPQFGAAASHRVGAREPVRAVAGSFTKACSGDVLCD
jgi:hypothetical protein